MFPAVMPGCRKCLFHDDAAQAVRNEDDGSRAGTLILDHPLASSFNNILSRL